MGFQEKPGKNLGNQPEFSTLYPQNYITGAFCRKVFVVQGEITVEFLDMVCYKSRSVRKQCQLNNNRSIVVKLNSTCTINKRISA